MVILPSYIPVHSTVAVLLKMTHAQAVALEILASNYDRNTGLHHVNVNSGFGLPDDYIGFEFYSNEIMVPPAGYRCIIEGGIDPEGRIST